MKKYFVSSDIHSFHDEWMKALEEAGFDSNNNEHYVIVCGDLLDRGNKPLECLKFVNDLHKQGRAVLVKGNHEDLLEDIFERKYFERHDESNGTLKTCELISGIELTHDDWLGSMHACIEDTKNNTELKYYLDNVVDYYETKKYVFVHGWIPVSYTEDDDFPAYMSYWHPKMIKDKNWRKGDWSEARWLNGMEAWHNGIKLRGKTIVCGHWSTSYGHSKYHREGWGKITDAAYVMTDEELERLEKATDIDDIFDLYEKYVNNNPFVDKGIIALDTTTVLTKKVNVIVIEED